LNLQVGEKPAVVTGIATNSDQSVRIKNRLSNSLNELVLSRTPSQSGGGPSDGALSSKSRCDRIEKYPSDQWVTNGGLRQRRFQESSGGEGVRC